MPSLCRSAEATREWFRAFTAHSFWHAVLSDPEGFDIYIQIFHADIGLRRLTTGSALPTLPQSVSRGR